MDTTSINKKRRLEKTANGKYVEYFLNFIRGETAFLI